MGVGAWNVTVTTNAMPEKIATAISELNDQFVGAEYTPIAYVGYQLVNGTNHAVLAEQDIVTGKDTKNVVLLIFNEKGMDVDLVAIERIVQSGEAFGGTVVDVKTDIPEDAQKTFDRVLGEFVGALVEPVALLGTQVVKGVNYVFAAEVTPVTVGDGEHVKKFCVVVVNSLDKKASFADVLKSGLEVALGKPLGEWP
jgi:hypothetical protein